MKTSSVLPLWSIVAPFLCAGFWLLGLAQQGGFWQILGALLLGGAVFAAVHHAEVVAHKVGEPWGAIILAVAITVLEVGLIVSLMFSGKANAASLARDTVFAAIMITLNGILGLCLLVGGWRHHEQSFVKDSAAMALATLVSILALTLVLPNFTTSTPGPHYSATQLGFAAIASLVLYASFILAQTVRHRDYFVDDEAPESGHAPSLRQTLASGALLALSLAAVVFLAKALSPAVEHLLAQWGAPQALVGVIVAAVVLLPEASAAVRAAHQDQLQTSINLSLGSAIASIGLTIPAVAVVCLIMDFPLVLGLSNKEMVLLMLSSFTVMLSLNHGRTNVLYGVVLLVNLAAYVLTVVAP